VAFGKQVGNGTLSRVAFGKQVGKGTLNSPSWPSRAFPCLVVTAGFEKGVREGYVVDMVHCCVLENVLVDEEKHLARTERRSVAQLLSDPSPQEAR
jgi:hypothetical protein